MRRQFLPWLAGFIDAVGSIFVGIREQRSNKVGNPYIVITPVVNVTQHIKYKWVCEQIRDTLNLGKVYIANRKGANAKVTWQTTKMEEVIKVLDLILPYMVVKKPQALAVTKELRKWIGMSSIVNARGNMRTSGLTIRKQKNVLSMVKMATELNSDMRSSTRYRGYHTYDYWEPLIKQWYHR